MGKEEVFTICGQLLNERRLLDLGVVHCGGFDWICRWYRGVEEERNKNKF